MTPLRDKVSSEVHFDSCLLIGFSTKDHSLALFFNVWDLRRLSMYFRRFMKVIVATILKVRHSLGRLC